MPDYCTVCCQVDSMLSIVSGFGEFGNGSRRTIHFFDFLSFPPTNYFHRNQTDFRFTMAHFRDTFQDRAISGRKGNGQGRVDNVETLLSKRPIRNNSLVPDRQSGPFFSGVPRIRKSGSKNLEFVHLSTSTRVTRVRAPEPLRGAFRGSTTV